MTIGLLAEDDEFEALEAGTYDFWDTIKADTTATWTALDMDRSGPYAVAIKKGPMSGEVLDAPDGEVDIPKEACDESG